MQTAGFVLAGGASSRMGRNKAFLRSGHQTFIEIAATAVTDAAGNATIIGQPEIHSGLGYPVIPDRLPGAGPLAGIETALFHTPADWNLIVACDMPRLQPALLRTILETALAHPDVDCVLPRSASGRLEPLCAAYHKRALVAVAEALAAGVRKVTDGLARCSVHYLAMPDLAAFQNVNTPEDWVH